MLRRELFVATFVGALLSVACTKDFDSFTVAPGDASPSGKDAGAGGAAADGSSGATGGADAGSGGQGGSAGSPLDSGAGGAGSGGAPMDGGGTGGGSSCGPTQKACGTTCVERSDPATGCGRASCDPCPTGKNVSSTTCSAQACAVGACAAGYDDCNSQSDDGCERAISGDVFNCGACDRACGTDHVASRSCDQDRCASTCELGRANCSRPTTGNDDGCEVDATADAQNCGGCGNQCPSGQACKDSACGCTSDAQCRSGGASNGNTCDEPSGLCHCAGGATCAHGEICSRGGNCTCNGGAACQAGNTCCRSPAGCRDLMTSTTSCGACGHSCPDGFVCNAGTCACNDAGDCDAGSAGTCDTGVCHCGTTTCGAGQRCLADGGCG